MTVPAQNLRPTEAPRELQRIGHTLYHLDTRTVSFAPLRGMTPAQLGSSVFIKEHPHGELIDTLRQIILISGREWRSLGERGHHFNRESVSHLLDLYTRPSSQMVVQTAHFVLPGPNHPIRESRVTGCFFWMTDVADFPDKDKLPTEYIEGKLWNGKYPRGSLGRAYRSFVTDEGRALAPRGEALERIMEEFERKRNGQPILTRIIVGPEKYQFTWSSNAFQMRGFENTGVHLEVPDTLLSGEKVTLDYAWFVYPPQTPSGFQTMAGFKRRFDTMLIADQRRILDAAAHLSPLEGSIAVIGSDAHVDAPLLARLYPTSRVYAVTTEPVPADARNLKAVPLEGLPPNLHGLYCTGAEGIDSLRSAVRNVAPMGSVVVRGRDVPPDLAEQLGLRGLYSRRIGDERIVAAETLRHEDDGVELVVTGVTTPATSTFLSVERYRRMGSGQTMEMVRRGPPGTITLDVLPYTKMRDGRVFVITKLGSPRHLVKLTDGMETDTEWSGYVPEQFGQVVTPVSSEGPEREREFAVIAREIVARRAALPASEHAPRHALTIVTSSAGPNEMVRGYSYELDVPATRTTPAPYLLATGGTCRPVELQQALGEMQRCFATGREERQLYELALYLRQPLGPWLSDPVDLSVQEMTVRIDDLGAVFRERSMPAFERLPNAPSRFFQVSEAAVEERSRSGRTLASRNLSFVGMHPDTKFGNDTLVFLPIIQTVDGPMIGLERRELPAVQDLTGSPLLTCAPGFRVPRDLKQPEAAITFGLARLREQFETAPLRYWQLGFEVYPSLGILPERTSFYAVEMNAAALSDTKLVWGRLSDAVSARRDILCGHTYLAVMRGAHATDILRDPRLGFDLEI